MHLDVRLARPERGQNIQEEREGGESERERQTKRDKVRERDGGSDSLMLSGHREMCVTQSQIGNRCFNLASLRGYPLH